MPDGIDASMGFLGSDDPLPDGLDQFWRCPRCGAWTATGYPAKMYPGKCGMGHAPVEMEQVTREAIMADRESNR